MLEYEKKVLLTEDEYAVLADQCRGISVESQTNYYFDTDDFYMNRKGITCRIRAKNGKYKTTIKNHSISGLHCSMEVDLCEGPEYNSKFYEVLGLHFQGELVTTRIILYKDAFCEAVLDQNAYLGHRDYELEVEYIQGCEDRALDYLKSVAECLVAANLADSVDSFLLRVEKDNTKSERFFKRKRPEGR